MPAAAPADAPPRQALDPARRAAMAALFVVALFNYLDRNMLSILQIPIKDELGLSDTQLGLLTGSAFALFYAAAAVPVARLADRWVRKTVLAVSLGVWSAATLLTGGAQNFTMLAALRMGVAAGESGCVPTSHSIISDYYPKERRASALAFWSISAPVGTMIGLGLAGWLNSTVGWRTAFVAAGLASAAFVPVLLVMLKEPPRGRYDTGVAPHAPPLRQAAALLWRNRALRYVILGVTLHAYFLYASINWAAPFYSRVHNLPVSEIALWLALLSGLGGGIGTVAGGLIADAWGKRDPAAYALVPALAAAIMIPAALAQYWAPGAGLSLGLAIVPAVLVNIYLAPSIGTAQTLVPPGMRAFVSAAIVLIANLFGMGLGPLLTGAISDLIGVEAQGLRWALTTTIAAEVFAIGFYLLAARHLRRAA